MTLPLNSELILNEMTQVIEIMNNIKDNAAAKLDMPMNDLSAEIFQLQFKSSVLLCANRLSVLADLLSDS